MTITEYIPRKMPRTPFTILPRHRPGVVRKPYITVAGLQFLDVALTWFILTAWSTRAEGNPVAAAILRGFGLEVGLLVLLTFKLGAVAVFYATQFPVRLAAAVYGLVVFNNLLFLGLWLHLLITR